MMTIPRCCGVLVALSTLLVAIASPTQAAFLSFEARALRSVRVLEARTADGTPADPIEACVSRTSSGSEGPQIDFTTATDAEGSFVGPQGIVDLSYGNGFVSGSFVDPSYEISPSVFGGVILLKTFRNVSNEIPYADFEVILSLFSAIRSDRVLSEVTATSSYIVEAVSDSGLSYSDSQSVVASMPFDLDPVREAFKSYHPTRRVRELRLYRCPTSPNLTETSQNGKC